jgi:hypothetical protein
LEGLQKETQMTANKTKQALTSIIAVALILSISYTAAARSPLSQGVSAAPGTQQAPDIHTIKDAGLQFELPKGWKAETQDNGNLVVSCEDGAVNVTFLVEDQYKEVVEGMKSGLKQKLTDVKSQGEAKEDTHNGMTHISESGTGMMEGLKITWSIDVLKATKNVTLLTFGVESILQTHIDEYLKLVGSLKKI